MDHSRDDTDRPFSFPAESDDIRAEWARSAGISAPAATAFVMPQLPWKISATSRSHGTAGAYNITTGLDPSGDGLFTDRGGRPRNSGNGPSFNSVSIYASRRVALPEFPVRPGRRIFIRVGLQGSNVSTTAITQVLDPSRIFHIWRAARRSAGPIHVGSGSLWISNDARWHIHMVR